MKQLHYVGVYNICLVFQQLLWSTTFWVCVMRVI